MFIRSALYSGSEKDTVESAGTTNRLVLLSCVCIGVGLVGGCGTSADKLVPVAGKVTLDDQLLKIGDVGFFPNAERGNPQGQAAVGVLGTDGSYRLLTGGKAGVRPGWYKVVVWATKDPTAAGNPWGPDGKPRPIKWLIPEKYTRVETTPLAVEVVVKPAPGQYDLRMSRCSIAVGHFGGDTPCTPRHAAASR
ncbi:MAG: hypothetical protein L0210_14120 [Rhodospirillales bacterium]|nr:hypothetical protein [Rhodospirillales bacterium]